MKVRKSRSQANCWVADGDSFNADYVYPDGTLGVYVDYPTEAEAQTALDLYLEKQESQAAVLNKKMSLERFDALVEYIVKARIKKVMCAKSKEYASGGNKLHNFDRAGRMRNKSPMEALRGMKLKHEVSIEDMLDGLKGGKTYPRAVWEEKFTDNINYQILQWAILARDNGWLVSADRTKPVPGDC